MMIKILFLKLSNFQQEHKDEFPVLASMAKDYLSFSATSASVQRCFSAAADICGRDRGSLATRKIEWCVSSHQWLAQGIEANQDFHSAQQFITSISKEKTIFK